MVQEIWKYFTCTRCNCSTNANVGFSLKSQVKAIESGLELHLLDWLCSV